MTNEQKAVLRKIIYAVETGGQVYGQQDYSDFTEAYANSSDEHAITIGAGQWYAEEAQTLLKRIHDTDTAQWDRLDNIGLWEQVQEADWSCFNISRNSQFANLIVQLISSKIGVKCQDNLMDEQLATYAIESQNLGVLDASGQAMCVNFRHQGGLSAVKRILEKAEKPYTLDNLYAACQTDTGNQVGVYKSRQRFVYNALKKYFPKEEQDNMTKTEKATKQMESWAQDNSHGYDQIYRWGEKGDYDCSSAVISAWQAAGVPVKSKGATYTGDMKSVFLACGFKDVTSKVNLSTGSGLLRGDVLLNETHHVAMYCGNGKEVEASINEKGTATGGQPGDQTGKEFLIRSYRNYPWDCILRYSENNTVTEDAVAKKQNTVAYVARMKKDSKCYTESNTKSLSKLFPKLKKGAVVDVMKYTETDSSGLKWYFVRIPYPNDDGFVFEFVPKGVFTRISEISK